MPMRTEPTRTRRPSRGERLSRRPRVPYPRCPAPWSGSLRSHACCWLAYAPAAAAAGRAGTARALAAQMRWAGGAAGALAVDLDSGRTIYSLRAGTQRMPASVQKLYTSVTALRRLGASGRLSTGVLAETRAGCGGRRGRRPLPARRRRSHVRRARRGPPGAAGRRRGHRRGDGPRTRGRVRVRQPPRGAVVRLPADGRGRPALGADASTAAAPGAARRSGSAGPRASPPRRSPSSCATSASTCAGGPRPGPRRRTRRS